MNLFICFVAILILIGHFIDAFIMIMPGTVGTHWHLGFIEIGTFLGYLGFFIFVVFVYKYPPGVSEHVSP